MKNLDDLSNAEGLDESISEDYSNAINWQDPFKGAREAAERTAKAAREAAERTAKAAREQAARLKKSAQDRADKAKKAAQDAAKNIKNTTKDIGKNIKSTTKDIGKNIKSTTKDLGKNISSNTQKIKDNAKKLADKSKENAKKMREKIKEAEKRIGKELKKVEKKLKDVGDKFLDKFRDALRIPIRNLILKSIRENIHGLATKMFAAIGTADEVKAKKIKASFVSKAKKAYASTLEQWKKLGGSESQLNDAIRIGSSKKMLKNPFSRADGNNHDEFYSYIASEDYYYGVTSLEDEELAKAEAELAKAEAEKIKADEEAAAVINEDAATLEVPEEEEKVSGFKAFIAKILAFFRRNKGDENPYEEGDPAADEFDAQEKGDEGNEPEGEGDGTVLDELLKDDGSNDDDSADGDKILGMPKMVAIGLGVAVLAVGGLLAYKYFKGKK
jgi:hypothetical protein